MASIITRKLDANGDPMRGSGMTNFVSDIDAVAVILGTTLKLLMGEWFEDTSDGTPLFQSLLGHPITSQGVALLLRRRILSVPYVTAIDQLNVIYAPSGRIFTFVAVIATQFGGLTITNAAIAIGAPVSSSPQPDAAGATWAQLGAGGKTWSDLSGRTWSSL